jgi:hypothetical protein
VTSHPKNLRHCEERSDEAIQSGARDALDCFATLAMTNEAGAVGP